MLSNTHTLSSTDFSDALFNLIYDAEGLGPPLLDGSNPPAPFAAYYDPKGIITIGLGFNLTVAVNVLNILSEFGLNISIDTASEIAAYLSDQTDSSYANEFVGSNIQTYLNSLLTVTAQNGTMQTYHNGSFKFANLTEVRDVFKNIYPNYENAISPSVRMADTSEEVALVSLQFNSSSKNPLLGPTTSLQNDLLNDKRAQAWYEIRYNSNLYGTPGVDARRLAESQVFDLYGSAAQPDPNAPINWSALKLSEVLPIWQMFTAERGIIIKAEDMFAGVVASANRKYVNEPNIETWSQEFDPAWQILRLAYGGGLPFAENEGQPFQITYDESNVWADASGDIKPYSIVSAVNVSTNVQVPSDYFLIGGFTAVVARTGTAPSATDIVTIIDQASSAGTLIYSNTAGVSRVVTLEPVIDSPITGDPGAPTWDVSVVSRAANLSTSDLDYNFATLDLGGGAITFAFSAALSTPTGLKAVDAGQQSTGASTTKTLDLTEYPGTSFSRSVEGQAHSFTGADLENGVLAPSTDGAITFTNFNTLRGSNDGDYIINNTEFKHYSLENGSNYIGDVSGPAIDGQSGPAANWVTVDLGAGSSTVGGGIAQGSIITADTGHIGDVIEISPNTELVGLNPTDQLTWGGQILTGGVRISYSDSPWAVSLSGLFEYGINQQGDLEIRTPTSLYSNIGSSAILDPSTYVTGYEQSSDPNSSNVTAGIKTLQINVSAFAFAGGGIGGLVNFDLTSVGVDQAITALEEPSASQQGNSAGARWTPPVTTSPAVTGVADSASDSTDYPDQPSSPPDLTPSAYIVLDLSGLGIATSAVDPSSSSQFDINADDFSNPSGWIGPDQAFLVLPDVTSGVVSASQFLTFAQLETYDQDGSGSIDAGDPIWSQLRIWQDTNGNEQVDAGELQTLDQVGITSISLAVTPQSGTTQQGNVIAASSSYTMATGSSGIVAAINFKVDEFDTTYLGSTSTTSLAASLPDLPGHGTLLSLREAMTSGETETTADDGSVQVSPSALETAVQEALAAWPVSASFPSWLGVLSPVFAAWAASSPTNPHFTGAWLEQQDAAGNAVANAPSSQPDVYLVTSATDSGLTVVNELVYEVTEVPQNSTDPSTGVTTQTYEPVGHWVFASGAPITDAQGNAIAYATLDQALASPLPTGETWTTIPSGVIDFLELYTGETIPLGVIPAGSSIDAKTLTSTFNQLNTLLDLTAIRFALQVPSLEPIFGSITYNEATDQFTGNTDLGFEPVLQAIFAAAPTDAAAATSYLQAWWPIVADILNDFQRPDQALVTPDYVFGLVVAAWEATSLPLSLAETAQAFGITTPIIMGTGTVTGPEGTVDVFYAGAGDTTLVGGSSGNEFVLGGLYKNVEIDVDEGVLAEQSDTLRFATLKSTDVQAVRDGNDLLLLASDGSQVVRVTNQFLWDDYGTHFIITGNFAPHYGVSDIVFADGVTWTPLDIGFATAQQHTHDQLIVGTSGHEVLYAGPNDTLEGGGGEDVYIFDRGDGNTTINVDASDWITGKSDTLLFGAGIKESDLVFTRDPSDISNLIIGIAGTNDSVTIDGQFKLVNTVVFGSFWSNRIDTFVFADGSAISGDQLMPIVLQQEVSSGATSVYGYQGNDTLDAGPGDRYVSGGDGNDLYIYNLGYGDQTFERNQQNILNGGDDTIRFGEGITPTNISYSRQTNSSDLILKFTDGGELTIVGQFTVGYFFNVTPDRFNDFTFANGAVLNSDNIIDNVIAQADSVGDTTVYGFDTTETLDDPHGGVEYLTTTGLTTFVFGLGYGADTIDAGVSGSSSSFFDSVESIIQFGAGITLSNLVISAPAATNTLIIAVAGTNDRLTIVNGAGRSELQDQYRTVFFEDQSVNVYNFADGTTTNLAALQQMYLQQAAAAGSPVIDGFGGSDTFAYHTGEGLVELNETSSSGSSEASLQFGPEISASSLTFTEDANGNLFVRDGVPGDRIELDLMLLSVAEPGLPSGTPLTSENTLTPYGVATFQFADGTSLVYQQILSLADGIVGTSGSDTLVGTVGPNVIDGMGAYDGTGDYEVGNGGADTFIYKAGYGRLEINESSVQEFVNENGLQEFQAVLQLDGVPQSAIAVTNTLGDLFITDGIAGDQVQIDAEASGEGVSVVEFSDGSSLTRDQLLLMAPTAITGTTGVDNLTGTLSADILDGKGAPAGSQDDEIGDGGADTFIYEPGYGQLEISEANYGNYTSIVQIGSGLTASDITARTDGENIYLADGITGDSIILAGELEPYTGIDAVHFADGTTLTRDDLVAMAGQPIGTTGADVLGGGSTPETFDGEGAPAGLQDAEHGLSGADTFVFNPGYGHLFIVEYSPSNPITAVLQMGAGLTATDISVTSDGDSLYLTDGVSGDQIELYSQICDTYNSYGCVATVDFADGTSLTAAQLITLASHVIGTTSADSQSGTPSADVLDGKGAPVGSQDFEDGDGGADTFIYDPGYGKLYVEENNATQTTAIVQFGDGITASDISVSSDGSGLYLKDGLAGDSIYLRFELESNEINGVSHITALDFADGTSLTSDQLIAMARQVTGTTGADSLIGTPFADIIDGKGAPSGTTEYEDGEGGSDTFIFDAGYGQLNINEPFDEFNPGGEAVLQFGPGIDPSRLQISSNSNADLILTDGIPGDRIDLLGALYGSSHNIAGVSFVDGTFLSLASLSHDLTIASTNQTSLFGFTGVDTFIVTPDLGAISIYEDAIYQSSEAVLRLGTGIAPNDLSISEDSSGDVFLSGGTLGDQITIDSMLAETPSNSIYQAGYTFGVQTIQFSDGTTLDRQQLIQMLQVASPSNPALYGTTGADTFDGGIYARYEQGNGGDDTFIYSAGDGGLEINEDPTSNDPGAAIELNGGITSASLSVSGDAKGDLILTDGVSGDRIQVDDFENVDPYRPYESGVSEVTTIADAVTLDRQQITSLMTTGSPSNTMLYGSSGAETFDSKGEATYEQGNGGADTFIYDPGYGQLEINETLSSAQCVVAFGVGISPDQIAVSGSSTGYTFTEYGLVVQSSNIIISDGITGDQIQIDQMGPSQYGLRLGGVDHFVFADGTTLSYQQIIERELTSATSANDTLVGFSDAEVFDGKGGDDYEAGGGGADTFIFNENYGHLEIKEDNSQSGASAILQLGAGLTAADLKATCNTSGDLYITDGISGDLIKIDGMLPISLFGIPPIGISLIQLADGSTLSYDQIVGIELNSGSIGSDTLVGTAGADVIDGRGGGDYEVGNGGADTFVYNQGYGDLEILELNDDYSPSSATLLLGAGITRADLGITTDGNNIFLTDGTVGDQVQLDYADFGSIAGVATVQLADGSTINEAQLLQLAAQDTSSGVSSTITGTPGSDQLQGTSGPDFIDGQGGNDTVTGGGGADTFVFDPGYGGLEINETGSSPTTATLQLGVGIIQSQLDVTSTSDGSLVITDEVSGDQITLDNAVDDPMAGVAMVQFADGTDLTRAELLALAMMGTPGSDQIYGSPGADLIDGKGGGDYEKGSGGADTFVYDPGYGALEIDAEDPSGDTSTLQLGSGITLSLLAATTNGSEITLTDGIAGDQITLDNADDDPDAGVATVQFADGTSISRSELLQLAASGNGPSGSASSTITGTSGSEQLQGTSGPDLIDGLGGNDTVMGGGGADTFVFNPGYGQLKIDETGSSPTTATLQIGVGITQSQLDVTSTAGGDLVLTDGMSGDQITLDNALDDPTTGVAMVQFADGTDFTRAELLAAAMTGTPMSDKIYGSTGADLIDGKGGSDYEKGDGGADTFVYDPGYGALEIDAYDASGNTSTLQLGSGITQSDLITVTNGNEVVLTDGIAGDQITLDGANSDPNAGVATVRFTDGSAINQSQLLQLAAQVSVPSGSASSTITGTTGGDQLQGMSGSDLIDGLGAPAGSQDYENGGGGQDTFVFNASYGNADIVDDNGGAPATSFLRLGAGINPADISVSSDDTNVYLSDSVTGDYITLANELVDDSRIAAINFSNGAIWSQQQLAFLAQYGTAGADTIQGSVGNEILDGRGGGDVLIGGGGYDTYLFKAGYGALTIENATSGSSNASGELDFGQGLTENNLWFSQSGNDLIIQAIGSPDVVDIKGWYGLNGSAALAHIVDGSGLRLDGSLNQLVSAMARYESINPGFSAASATIMPTDSSLQASIIAAWHH